MIWYEVGNKKEESMEFLMIRFVVEVPDYDVSSSGGSTAESPPSKEN